MQARIVEPSSDYNSWTFDPDNLTVHRGDTIVWTNAGQAAHTATADDKVTFDSGALTHGQQFRWVAAKAGTFPYHCTFHPWMKGTVTVVEG